MIPLSATVLLIENDLDDAPKIAEMISATGYDAILIRTSHPSDTANAIMAHSPTIIISQMLQSNMAIDAIMQSHQTIPLILVGGPSDTPMIETYSSLKIAYITYPFSQGVLKAIIQLLV